MASVRVGSFGSTASVRGPIEFEVFVLGARNHLTVESCKDFFGGSEVLELDKTVPDGDLLLFIFYQLNTPDVGQVVEHVGHVLLVHPRLDVTDPESPLLDFI